MLSQIYASIGSFLPQPMKQRSLNYQKLLQLLWKSFLCRLFFQMFEINYIPIYMKINHRFFVIKGQFPSQYNNIVFHTVVPRPLSNDPRFTQCIYRYSRASKRFVEV